MGALLLSPHSHLVSSQVYVQHLLKKNKENVWKLVNEGMAHIYVCGYVWGQDGDSGAMLLFSGKGV